MLKLPRPLLEPALNDDLLLGEEFNGISSLTMHITVETVLPTAEGKEGHRSSDADVDTNVASFRLIAKLTGSGTTAGE